MQPFKKIAIGISGGIDSAVSALILKNKGYEVIGTFMRNWNETDESIQCTADKDLEDAKFTCDKLNIPLKEVNFVKEYWNNVFQVMVNEYVNGLTPNPDILCNSHIKFNSFYKYCLERLHVDAIATGHYVRTSYGPFLENYNPDEKVKLLKGVDDLKDQSFFLSKINQIALQRSMFPVGELTKTQVKSIAQKNGGLERILQRKESMGICFIGKTKFQEFLSQYVPDRPGRFVDIDSGEVVGEHNGIHHWTVGQRSRIGKSMVPYYVAVKHFQTGNVFVVKGAEHPALVCRSLVLSEVNWITGEEPEDFAETGVFKCTFRCLHRRPVKDCVLVKLSEDSVLLDTDDALYAVPPGQFAVFYEKDQCLGCAKIMHAGPSDMFGERQLAATDLETTKMESKPP